jgi:hypothetical protein
MRKLSRFCKRNGLGNTADADVELIGKLTVRRVAELSASRRGLFVRAMICESQDSGGSYVFLFDSLQDGPCIADYMFETVREAERYCLEELGILSSDWQAINDPQVGCQDDWIAPVRVKRNQDGQPLWGQFEPAIET